MPWKRDRMEIFYIAGDRVRQWNVLCKAHSFLLCRKGE
jgi:hypothetical protein